MTYDHWKTTNPADEFTETPEQPQRCDCGCGCFVEDDQPNMNYQHPLRPCIKVTCVNGRGYGERGRTAKGLPYGSRLALSLPPSERGSQ